MNNQYSPRFDAIFATTTKIFSTSKNLVFKTAIYLLKITRIVIFIFMLSLAIFPLFILTIILRDDDEEKD